MTKWIIAYGTAALAFGALDAIWLRWAAGNLYRPVIGDIMAKDFNMAAAGVLPGDWLADAMERLGHQPGKG